MQVCLLTVNNSGRKEQVILVDYFHLGTDAALHGAVVTIVICLLFSQATFRRRQLLSYVTLSDPHTFFIALEHPFGFIVNHAT